MPSRDQFKAVRDFSVVNHKCPPWININDPESLLSGVGMK